MGLYITIGVIGAIALFIFWKVIKVNLRNKQCSLLMREPIDESFPDYIEKNIPLYNRLPVELKQQLHGLVNVFLAEKAFVGCGGQEITDEVRVTIAAQACMLLLNRKTNFYPKLKTIYVYPHTYVAKGLMN
ncbi:MAG: zinc-dependent peptidase, partial [Planctomycetota bacterium]